MAACSANFGLRPRGRQPQIHPVRPLLVADAERALPGDTPHRDLVLHLVAAHHGWARPGFPSPDQWDPEGSPTANCALAERIADRYARLSAEYGPWRLAWLESLVKAADAWVSSGQDA